MEDAHAALKVGGHFITAYRGYLDEPGEKHGFRDKLDQLEKEGKWKQVYKEKFQRGTKGHEV